MFVYYINFYCDVGDYFIDDDENLSKTPGKPQGIFFGNRQKKINKFIFSKMLSSHFLHFVNKTIHLAFPVNA